jgi:hypothetical protein
MNPARRSELLCPGVLCLLAAPLLFACAGERETETANVTAVDSSDLFVDRAEDFGIDFVHFAGACGELYLAEMMGSGAALVDYDNDGDLDIYLVQGNYLHPDRGACPPLFLPASRMEPLGDRLYRSDLGIGPEGTPSLFFTDVTAESGITSTGYGMGVAVGDINNDGWQDLYVTNLGENRLFMNNGDLTFTERAQEAGVADPRWSASSSFIDFDHDGWLDLYVTNYVDFTVPGHQLCRSLTGAPDYCGPLAYPPLSDSFFRNRGDGTFDALTWTATVGLAQASGLGVTSGDFDGDRRLDLYVANDGMPNFLWTLEADGTLRNRAMETGSALSGQGQAEAGMGVAVGDIDADGDEDLLVTHLALETNTFYRNLGSGIFDDQSAATGLGTPSWPFTGFGTAWIDYDNDGWLDLLAVNGAVKLIPELAAAGDPYPLSMPNHLYHNLGQGKFEDATLVSGDLARSLEVSRGVATGDVDNDGDVDVLLSNNSGQARLLINQIGQDRHWLGLRLLGDQTPRDMLGAWVGIRRPGAPTLWRRVRTDGSYLSASDPRLLIGLGDFSGSLGVEVLWPDGSWEEFSAPSDAYSVLRQGSGRAIDAPR